MSVLTRASLLLLLAVGYPGQVTAQLLPMERLRDWEFRFYACKHVLINSAYVLRVMDDLQIAGEDAVDKLEKDLGPALAVAIPGNEREYQFSEAEALFVSDLTFAVVSGVLVDDKDLTDIRLISSASDLCVRVIEGLSE